MNIPNKPDGSGLMDIPQEPVPDATFIAPAYLAFSRGTTQKPECLCRRSEKSLSLGAAAVSHRFANRKRPPLWSSADSHWRKQIRLFCGLATPGLGVHAGALSAMDPETPGNTPWKSIFILKRPFARWNVPKTSFFINQL